MSTKSNTWITAVVVLILAAAIFYFGYTMRGVWSHATAPIHDTIIKFDTVIHHIPDTIPYYISKTDTVILRDTIPIIPDTAAILQKYFAYYTYCRSWKDSSLIVILSDVISENKIFDSDFDYKILRPQEIINTVNYINNYPKYIYLGMQTNAMDVRYTSFSVFRASKRLLIGGGYIPYQKDFALTVAFKIGQMK